MYKRVALRYIHQSQKTVQRCCSSQMAKSKLQLNRSYSPEQGFYLRSPYQAPVLPECTLDEYVWKNVNNWHSKEAVVCGATGRGYTYAQLRDSSAALAVRLQTQYKLKKGDVVAVCLPNVPEYAIAVLGAIEAGLTVTTINPKYTVNEMARQISLSDTKLMFGLVEQFKSLKSVEEVVNKTIPIVSLKTNQDQSTPIGSNDFHELMESKDVDFSILSKTVRQPSDVCLLPYSSGTTGVPKGVMLTHTNLTTNSQSVLGKLPNESLFMPATQDFQDTIPNVLPLFHVYGLLLVLLGPLSVGCKIVTIPKYQLEEYLKVSDEHKATFMHLVPHIIIQAAHSAAAQRKHFKRVRSILSAAAPIGSLDYTRFKEKCPNTNLLQAYGLTEVSPLATITPINCSNYASVGHPLANTEIKVTKVNDPNFIGLDCNEVGELLVRGQMVMKGYFDNDKATADTITKDGWLRTGDIGSYDSDGHFYIKDRLKELIKVKGFQVAPAELEELIRNYPKVLDAVVVGVPHPVNGEAPRAFVVKDSDATFEEEDLIEYIKENVVSYKRLEGGVVFIDKLPKTDSGKYLRRQLKESAAQNSS